MDNVLWNVALLIAGLLIGVWVTKVIIIHNRTIKYLGITYSIKEEK